jgi:tRNA A37 N6-isopentenylltransferase MiaA
MRTVSTTRKDLTSSCQRMRCAHHTRHARQVYRGLDVGSAKLPVRQRQGVAHHLLDVLSPHEEMNAGDWADAAAAAAADCARRGKVPIVVGGTGFYLRWYEHAAARVYTHRGSTVARCSSRTTDCP